MSPQYHCVFEDHFSTVASNGAFNADVWDSLVMSNTERHASIKVRPDGSTHVPSNHVSFEVPPIIDSLVTLHHPNFHLLLRQILRQSLH